MQISLFVKSFRANILDLSQHPCVCSSAAVIIHVCDRYSNIFYVVALKSSALRYSSRLLFPDFVKLDEEFPGQNLSGIDVFVFFTS